MKKKLDKASVHNGRANSKGVAYNANHNTLELSGTHQPHIDPDRMRRDVEENVWRDSLLNWVKSFR